MTIMHVHMATAKKRKGPECVYCNHAPVDHGFEYFNTTSSLIVGDFLTKAHLRMKMPAYLERFAINILLGMNFVLESVRVIRYTGDIEKAPSERARVILREAEKRNIPVEVMTAFGQTFEIARAFIRPKGSKNYSWTYFNSIPVPSDPSGHEFDWVDDKRIFNQKFLEAKLPVAASRVVTSQKDLLKAFRDIGAPVIIKPREGSRARHTTINIKDEKELVEAYKRAKQLCRYVLVEKYIPGNVYRATCVGKKLVGILELVKATVTADGVMNIREILEYYNTHKKYEILTDVVVDELFHNAIAHQGYTMDSIPPKGEVVVLTEYSERTNGGYFVDITDEVPEENKVLIEKGAVAAGIDLIGFDVISRDLTKSCTVEPLTFIEGNTLPFIEVHLTPYAGKPRDTAKAVWDLWY